jgi:hypothetical protein
MNVQSISWLHGTMQCEVKSKLHGPKFHHARSWLRGALLFVKVVASHWKL